MSTPKAIAFTIVALVLALALFELVARLVLPESSTTAHDDHAEVIRVLGLPTLNETMTSDSHLFWRLTDQLDDYRVHGTLFDKSLDFRVSIKDSRRVTPTSDSSARLRILTIGNSCTFGVGVDDSDTWPSHFARLLTEAGHPVALENAGVPGYTSFQGARLLAHAGFAYKPDLVIATFGTNEKASWGDRSDYDLATVMERQGLTNVMRRSRAYQALERILGRSNSPDEGAPGEAPTRNDDLDIRPRLTTQEFRKEILAIQDACARRSVKVLFLTWPTAEEARSPDSERNRYANVLARLHANGKIQRIDLHETLLSPDGALFVDHVHTGARGSELVGQVVAQRVLAEIQAGALP